MMLPHKSTQFPAAGKKNAGGRSQRRAGKKGTSDDETFRTWPLSTQ
jgi:hypothetical protein